MAEANSFYQIQELLRTIQRKLRCVECCTDNLDLTTLSPPVIAPLAGESQIRFNATTGVLYYWDGDSWEIFNNLFSPSGVVVESAAPTLTLGAAGHYIFTGTTSTWSLPTVSPALIGREYSIKNRGSGGLTINVTGGGATIYDFAVETSIIIPAGEAREITQDSTYWNVH